jgi:hypothetical protein
MAGTELLQPDNQCGENIFGTYICNSFTAKQLCFLRSTISLEFKNSMLCLTKLNCVFACWDLECQRCPIDDIGVLVYHVMADCWVAVKRFPIFSYFSTKITDEFLSKFQFIFAQLCLWCDLFRMCVGSPFILLIMCLGRNAKGSSLQIAYHQFFH